MQQSEKKTKIILWAVIAAAVIGCAKLSPVNDPEYSLPPHDDEAPITAGTAIRAWMPFILIFVFLLMTSKLIPAIHDPLNLIKTSVLIYDGPGGEPYTFTWLATMTMRNGQRFVSGASCRAV